MGGEDADKIIRIPGEDLLIKLSPEEVEYRNKYLPDPTKLTDEKLVCTVCSVPLAQDIHKGKDIFIHRVLQVLVCEPCYVFYGDGCFSVDEDGDDKYCRWCGQGGTLYLCSTCSCAFCQKCVKQNLKPSVLADLDNDDWKCYICSPRPLFGCRTICWGAEKLNKIGKAKEQERLQKQKEKLAKLSEKKSEENGRRPRKASTTEEDTPSKKKRTRAQDSDSSSPEVMPAKRSRRETRASTEIGNLNGSIGKVRRRKDSSSDNESSEEEKKVTRHSRSTSKKNKKPVGSSSEDSDVKSKRKSKYKKKKPTDSSDESSEEDKKKSKQKSTKKKVYSSDDNSSDEKQKKKKITKKRNEDTSSDEKRKKKKHRRKKKETSSDESSDDDKKKSKKLKKKKKECSSDESENDSKKDKKKEKYLKGGKKTDEVPDSDSEPKKEKKNYDTEREKDSNAADNIIVKKRIKLAILWLNNATNDISELGSLISMRATKFCKKKLNAENFKSYDDVLTTVSKLKQLMSGIHSNYEHIEKTLDAHLKPWKILTGLEEPENEKADEEISLSVEETVPKAKDSSVVSDKETNVSDVTKSTIVSETVSNTKMDIEKKDEFHLQWSGDSDGGDNSTKQLINRAKETLDEVEKTDKESPTDKTTDEINENKSCKTDIGNNIENNIESDSKPDSSLEVSNEKTMNSTKCVSESPSNGSLNNSEENLPDETDSDKEEKNIENNKTSSPLSKKADNKKSEEIEETQKKNTETSTVENKSKSELKTILKKTPKIKSSNNESEESDEYEVIKTPVKKSVRRPKEENESKVSETVLQNGLDLNEVFSSDDSSGGLCAFSKKIKDKWHSEQLPEEMHLKSSLGLDSSGDSDGSLESSKEGKDKKVLKKKSSEDELKTTTNSKKIKLEDYEEEQNLLKTESSEKENKVKEKSRDKEEKVQDKKKQKNKQKEIEEEVSENDNIQKNKKNKQKVIRKIGKESGKKTKEEERNKQDDDKADSEEEENTKSNKKDKQYDKEKKVRIGGNSKQTEHQREKRGKDETVEANEKDKKIKLREKGREADNEEQVQKNKKSKYHKESEEEDSEGDEKTKLKKRDKKKKSINEKEDSEEQIKTNIKKEKNKDKIKEEEIKKSKKEKENKKHESDEEDIEGKHEKFYQEEEDGTIIKDSEEEYLESVSNAEVKTKFVGLDSSTEEERDQDDVDYKKVKEKTLKKKSVRNQLQPKHPLLLDSSDDEDNQQKNEKKKDLQHDSSDDKDIQVLEQEKEDFSSSPVVLSSANSSDSEILPKKKRKKQTSSDSDVLVTEENKKKKKRKLIRCADSNESVSSEDDQIDSSQKNTVGESPGKGSRKAIRKIKGKDDLAEATIEAAEEEKERRKRIEERQKLFNQVFEIKETAKLEKLVLDFDPKEKKELISVNQNLVSKMKPHQAKGVKFMWDSCFESLKQLKTKKGSGCILAHCMGLGKTFQVISLVHTLLTHEETQVHTVMVVCPLSTVLNWYNEFDKWLEDVEGGNNIEVFHLTKCKQNAERASVLKCWQHNGGVLIMGYEMFRNLSAENNKKFKPKLRKDLKETLIDPGADIVICDEGHMLKNEATALSKAMNRVRTLRRIVLTGTPMQNNLKEYHCMVQFVKPNLLGTRKEFLNRFVNPITNGQFVDSTEADVKVMKRRAHVLHKMLEGLVQRFDYNVLTPFLPPKHEYVINLCLSELQTKLYKHYLENFSQQSDNTKAGSRLFQDWQALGRIWTHPRVLKMSTDKANLLKEKRMLEESDEEGSLKDFIDDSEVETTSEDSSNSSSESDASTKSDKGKKKKNVHQRKSTGLRTTRSSAKNVTLLESSDEEKNNENEEDPVEEINKGEWWSELVEPSHLDDINQSAKLVLLFAILKECEMIEDKVLVFSQSLFSLDLIEYFLDKIDDATQAEKIEENLGKHQGTWSKGLDYFRLDGSTSSENRNLWCKAFNREDNPRARLFLISTRAGGLGINLTAANRVIIFDASWNPSHDVQSIFRVYRFGQMKPCYIYRFIAHGTMEEKVYDRQVAKQSMSNRVVDEQQVHRHFSSNDLNELYTYTPPTKPEDRPIPALPKDALMAEILKQYGEWIEKYHEHDSLLENVEEEELTEEERKLAWEDFENDKKRGNMPAPNMGTSGYVNNTLSLQIEYLRQQLVAKYPNKSKEELNQMLVYQVSMLMKQQQMAAKVQMGVGNTQMYPTMNLTPDQFNLQQQQLRLQYMQQMQMKQAQQAANLNNMNMLPTATPAGTTAYQQQMMMQHQANLARMQMQQMQQQKAPQNILQAQLSQPPINKNMQQLNNPISYAMQLENMKQRYLNPKQKTGSVTITELPQNQKPSDSSK